MADKKISALTAAATPLAGTEVLPIVQSGSTVKVSVGDLTAGRTVALRNANLTGGAAVINIGAAGDTSYHYMRYIDNGNQSFFLGVDDNAGSFFGAGAYGRVLYSEGSNPLKVFVNGAYRAEYDTSGNYKLDTGNLIVGTAGKGVTTSVTNGDVTITPDGTGKTILAKNGLRIPNNAAVTVGTSATQISVNAISWSSLAFVFGVDGGGAAFSDLVFYADGNTVALASRTVSGVPAARTYTAPSGQLNLAMASGSYSVFFQHIWTA